MKRYRIVHKLPDEYVIQERDKFLGIIPYWREWFLHHRTANEAISYLRHRLKQRRRWENHRREVVDEFWEHDT